MIRSLRRAAALALGAALLSGCAGDTAPKAPVVKTGDRRGLSLRAEVSGTDNAVIVETVVENNRAKPVYLDTDQCGRVTETVLARTKFQPKGKTWSGSLQAVKALVLDDQASREQPDRFAPRIPGNTSSDVPPPCVRPERPVKLAPGQKVAERWEMPYGGGGLAEVGSDGTAVRVEVVEARAPDDLFFLDMIQARHADEARAGRSLRVEERASSVIEFEPTLPPQGPSLGELYDLLLESAELRSWIGAQPADSWRTADLTPAVVDPVQFHLVSTRFERSALVTAKTDGTVVSLDLPTERDRTRVFPRRPGTLPPGIEVIAEPDGYVLTQDVLPGSVELPSGRVVVGEYLEDVKPLDFRVKPGSYPVHATMARARKGDRQAVAFGTIVLSDEATVRWKSAGSIAVDGGSTTITSPEGVAVLSEAFDRDEVEWWRIQERIWDSHAAHDHTVTEFALRPGVNLAYFSSGYGDGGYPVYFGLDAAGRPTRVVVDFFMLHLDWP